MAQDPAARPQLDTHAALQAHVGTLRAAGRHIGAVRWQTQDAWLKLSMTQPPAWRYQLLGAAARLLGQAAMRPLRPQGGSIGLRVEARRLRALRACGLRAPEVLDEAEHWLLLSDLGPTTLESLIRRADLPTRFEWWQRGADYIVQAHQSGQYLSQTFARNFVCSDRGEPGAIDFEDDALTAMPLMDAQIRDWLPYSFSTAFYFADCLPELSARLAATLMQESAAVRAGVRQAYARTAWLSVLRYLPPVMQRTDVIKTRCFGELARQVARG
jgi:hypothetical protein